MDERKSSLHVSPFKDMLNFPSLSALFPLKDMFNLPVASLLLPATMGMKNSFLNRLFNWKQNVWKNLACPFDAMYSAIGVWSMLMI
jgi:hypothetical protein